MKDILLQIPEKINDKVALYVDDKFVDNLDLNQVNQYRVNIATYIKETGDASILNRFYFVGHEDSDEIPGKEIKFYMEDAKGNLSDLPWEMNHVRRHMLTLIRMNLDIDNK